MIWGFPLVVVALVLGLILALPVVVLALAMGGVSLLTRRLARVLGSGKIAVPWRELVEYAPVVGWRPKANLDVHASADDVFRLTTGPDGWRGRITLAEADVVVFGDSFSFGHGANDSGMYTEFCGDLRVKSIGSDGYDMVHGLLWMRRLAPDLAGKLVVWFIYYGNDLHENLLPNMGKYRMPYVRQRAGGGEWEVAIDHVSPEPWPFKSPTSYHPIMASFSSSTPFSRRVFSACDFLVSEAAQLCEDAGARLAIVGIPDRVQLTARGRAKLARLARSDDDFDIEKPDREVRRTSDRLGIPFVPLRDYLTARDYLIHDIHWRASGHRKVGRILRELHAGMSSPETSALDSVRPTGRAGRMDVAS
jgi:hypothetical protein